MNDAIPGHKQSLLGLFSEFFFRYASRALHSHLFWHVKKEAIAQSAIGVTAIMDVELHTEQMREFLTHQQPTGVVFQVLLPILQLPFLIENAVVETLGEKEA